MQDYPGARVRISSICFSYIFDFNDWHESSVHLFRFWLGIIGQAAGIDYMMKQAMWFYYRINHDRCDYVSQ